VGQNQLLLIVLSVIIVGIAILVAINLFHENAASANLDQISYFAMELGTRAQKYYRTPIWLGGGGHSFSGLTADAQGLAQLTNIPQNEHGTFSISTAGNDAQVALQGIGVEDGDGDGTDCTVTLQVFADSMSLSITNR
jgi:hypothetical protein